MKTTHLPTKKIMTYFISFLVFLVITIFTYRLILKWFVHVDFSKLMPLNSNTLILLTTFSLLFVLMDAFRLHYVLRLFDTTVKLSLLITMSFIYAFLCNITPFILGGGFIIIYFLMRQGLDFTKATAVTFLRPFLASLFNIVTVPISLILLRNQLEGSMIGFLWMLLLLFTLFLGICIQVIFHLDTIVLSLKKPLYFLMDKNILSKGKTYAHHHRLQKQMHTYNHYLYFLTHQPKVNIVMIIVSTITYYLALFSFSFVLNYVFDLQQDPSLIFAKENIINFVMYFGVTPGGSGVAEGGYMYFFSHHIQDGVKLFSTTFYWRFFSVYFISLIGCILLLMHLMKLSLQKIRH